MLQDGLTQLSAAFPQFPVTGITVKEGLHLKSFMSMAATDYIAIGSSPAVMEAKALIESSAKFKYNFLQVPDNTGANCLFVNGAIVHVSTEAFPKSCEVFEKFSCPEVKKKIPLSVSELNKVDGCFTCCSVLIN